MQDNAMLCARDLIMNIVPGLNNAAFEKYAIQPLGQADGIRIYFKGWRF
jgi:hypothetical protein